MTTHVIGAGSFGTALAAAFAGNGEEIFLHGRSPLICEEINTRRINQRYTQDNLVPYSVVATVDHSILSRSDLIILAIPSGCIREVATDLLAPVIPPNAIVINAAKGLDKSGKTLVEAISGSLPCNVIGSLKGPTFSLPLLMKKMSGLTLALGDSSLCQEIASKYSHSRLEIEAWDSPRDIEYISSLKNVLAITLGIWDALELSSNTRYYLLTKLLRNARNIIHSLGCNPDVLHTYAGIGDILLTSLENSSRNRTLGLLIGKGFDFQSLKASPVAEGVHVTAILDDLLASAGSPSVYLSALRSLLSSEMPLSDFMRFFCESW